MMPRLQAEEQIERITAGRVVQGASDSKGRAAIKEYESSLERKRGVEEGTRRSVPPIDARARMAGETGFGVRRSGPRNPFKVNLDG